MRISGKTLICLDGFADSAACKTGAVRAMMNETKRNMNLCIARSFPELIVSWVGLGGL
jgi:hypothetical protein